MSHIYMNKVDELTRVIWALCLFSLLPLLAACDHIDSSDELIYVPQPPAKRVVLLEDYTGQMCVNCPNGSEVIEQLLEAYPDNLIAVGIHGGPLGFKGNSRTMGLATELGDEYYNHWKLEYQPVGLINRHGAVNYTNWIAAVKAEVLKDSYVEMSLSAVVQDNKILIEVGEQSLRGGYQGKVQVWVLEDGITASQKMPDGSTNPAYVHQHVLRAVVNGTWGEDLQVAEGKAKEQTYKFAVDPSWNKANLSVVAFVYNDQGVEQAIKAKVE